MMEFQLALSIIAAVALAALAMAAYSYYAWKAEVARFQDLDTERMLSQMMELAEKVRDLAEEFHEMRKQMDLDKATISRIELEFSELTEFVNRGIKRMSTRAQRAEMMTQFNEDLEELEHKLERPAGNTPDLFNPARRPRIVRKNEH